MTSRLAARHVNFSDTTTFFDLQIFYNINQWGIQDIQDGGVRQPIILAISSKKLHQIDKKDLTEKQVQISSGRYPPSIHQCQ